MDLPPTQLWVKLRRRLGSRLKKATILGGKRWEKKLRANSLGWSTSNLTLPQSIRCQTYYFQLSPARDGNSNNTLCPATHHRKDIPLSVENERNSSIHMSCTHDFTGLY